MSYEKVIDIPWGRILMNMAIVVLIYLLIVLIIRLEIKLFGTTRFRKLVSGKTSEAPREKKVWPWVMAALLVLIPIAFTFFKHTGK